MEPITSKGTLGRCLLCIPIDQAPALAKAIKRGSMTPKTYEAYNIDYDTDERLFRDLPAKVTFQAESLQDAKLRGADAISDQTGWCVSGFKVRRKQ